MRITLTPIVATGWIEGNTGNRPLSKLAVKRYAKAMESGEWVYNGEAIKISESGVILDGQHRIYAVIESGVSIDTEVITNIEGDVFGTLDQGRKRTNSDNFAVKGVRSYTAVAAIINPLLMLNDKMTSSLGSTKITKKQAYDYYILKEQFIDIETVNRKYIGAPTKYVNACKAYLTQFNKKEVVDVFFDQLYTGNIDSDHSQVLLLREWMIKSSLNKVEKTVPAEYVGRILKSFKNFKEGKSPAYIKLSRDNKSLFPFDESHK